MDVDPSKFERGGRERGAAARQPRRHAYDAEIFVAYTRHIIEQMGGARTTRSTRARARSTREWAACQHFELYDDVPPVLRQLADAGR